MRKLKFLSWFALTVFSATAWAQVTQGPWTYMDYRTGCCDRNANLAISFDGLNNSHWAEVTGPWCDGDGVGFTVKNGKANSNSKNGVYSTYYIDQTLESYSRKVLTWTFVLGSKSTKHYSNTCLYGLQGTWQQINALTVDFTEDYSNKTGSGNLLAQYRNTTLSGNGVFTGNYVKTFSFDNRNNASSTTKSWCLLLTHVVSSVDPVDGISEWGSFKHVSATWTTYYYKYVTYNGNGSTSGSMSTQTIENSGKLTNNAFSRTGYNFDGWATSSTGAKAYDNQGDISATSGSKGNVTLYARWNVINYTIGYTLNGGTVSGNPTSYNVETNTFTLNNPTRTGYTFTGWTGSNGNTPEKTVTIAKGSTGNKTYTANWQINNYNITYNLDGGSMSGNPSTYNIETNAFSLNAPVKNRYTFIGWTGSNGTTPQMSVQIAKGSIGNKNYTANWVYSRLAILEDLYNALGNDAWTGYGEQTGVISYSRGDDPDEFRATFMGGTYTIDIPFSDIPAASRVENTDGSFTYTLNVMLPALTGMSSETLHVTMKDGQITALDSENADIEMSKEAEICNWAALQEAMNAGGVIKLACDVSASSTDVALTVPAGKTVILELNGHTINRALTAPADNGSVIINNGTLAVMDSEGGKIIGGNTTGNGGAILNNGALTIYGGEITDNNAAGLGGGVYNNIDNTATTGFWMTGGYIMNNTANTHPAIGGDVAFNNLAVVQIYSDGTTVSAKTAKAGLANFSFIHPVMPDPVKFAMLAELYGALGNDTWTGYGENTGVISYSRGSEPNEFKATFMGGTYTIDIPFGDIPSVEVTPNTDDSYTYTLVVLLPAQTGLASETLHVTMKNGQITGLVSDNAGLVMGKETEICSWAALQEAMNAGGVIKLACNVSASSTDAALIVPAGKTVILELNGHTINRALTAPVDNGSVIINNGTLAVMDSEGGKIIGGNTTGNGGAILNNGALTLYGGELTGNRASAGGGVYNNIESTATTGFWMTGGLIDGNVANSNPAIGGDVIFNDYAAVQINADGKQVSIKTAVANMATYSYVKPVMPNFDDLPNTPVYYIGFQGTVLGGEMASFHSPEAPEISGYKFVRWEVQGGQVSDGFKVKAIYEALEPVNNAPAQVRVGNHTLEHRANNEYILK